MYDQPLVSIDVVPLRYHPAKGLLYGLGQRLFEPFLGEFALPGILLSPGETINSGAARALFSKVALEPGKLIQVGAFDETNRDPRGATISIALASVQPQSTDSTAVEWRSYEALDAEGASLPFDHKSIIDQAVKRLTQVLWDDEELTQSLLGETFTTADAVRVKSPTPHASNASRWLKRWGPLEQIPSNGATKRAGRPSTTWRWNS